MKALTALDTDVPVYLENTAGGDHAMARYFDTIGRLWDHIGDKGIGFCLDTCHTWAAGEALVDAVDRIKAMADGTRLYLMAPIVRGRKGEFKKEMEKLVQHGFTRARIDGAFRRDPQNRARFLQILREPRGVDVRHQVADVEHAGRVVEHGASEAKSTGNL